MYERFTDRARRIFLLANQEALRLQHEYIGTEHILLGLVNEGTGVAALVLNRLGLDLTTIRREVERLMLAGPEPVPVGKLPQTPRTKRVIEYAQQEANQLNHGYVGSEHILLGLLRERNGVAAEILYNLGVSLKAARAEVALVLGQSTEEKPVNPPKPLSYDPPPRYLLSPQHPVPPQQFPFPPQFQPENPAGSLVKPLMILLLMSLIVNVILAAFLWQLHFAGR